VQWVDVHVPTAGGREVLLTRYTRPGPELAPPLEQLQRALSPQPPPKISAAQAAAAPAA
jgi:hypothetical protein